MNIKIAAPLSGDPTPRLQWIEVASSRQIPAIHIIGLPSQEISEAKERIRAAIECSGLSFPKKRIVVNLSPAHVKKKGTSSDLAMALGILSEGESLEESDPIAVVACGELSLDGKVKPVTQLTRALYAAWESKAAALLLNQHQLMQARARLEWLKLASPFEHSPPIIIGVETLHDAWESFRDIQVRGPSPQKGAPLLAETIKMRESPNTDELMPIPQFLRRILGVAAAGDHHILLLGPKGAGKTHALEWLARLRVPPHRRIEIQRTLIEEMREPHPAESEVTGSRSDSGLRSDRTSPVRRVPPQVKPAALMGSFQGGHFRPGEISLAHGGLLIADEFPEWHRDSRETLRDPLEKGKVSLSRAAGTVELEAQFQFAATGNLCPCGGWPPELPVPEFPPERTDRTNEKGSKRVPLCKCTDLSRKSYLNRLSGPILDRIDLCTIISSVSSESKEIEFTELHEKVKKTQERLITTWGRTPGHLTGAMLETVLKEHPDWDRVIESSIMKTTTLSKRSKHKLLRVALTLAAWDGANEPQSSHFLEAQLFRADRLLQLLN